MRKTLPKKPRIVRLTREIEELSDEDYRALQGMFLDDQSDSSGSEDEDDERTLLEDEDDRTLYEVDDSDETDDDFKEEDDE